MSIVAKPAFVKPGGGAATVLPVGQKLVYRDIECAVGDGDVTECTQGSPPQQWLVISPSNTGVAPRPEGLPADFPDPDDFVLGDQSYVPGEGPKNIFPGVHRRKWTDMPDVDIQRRRNRLRWNTSRDHQRRQRGVRRVGRAAGTRKIDGPPKPTYPGPVHQLPAGQKITTYGATCMALADGGVACYGAAGGPLQGFLVTAETTSTFGGR